MLGEILSVEIFAFMMVFVRLGAALMVMPGFGEPSIPARYRLSMALFITLALSPLVVPLIPAQPDSGLEIFLLVGGETVIGLVIGATGRLMMTALHTAGTVIAFQSSLGFAQLVDPTQGIQGAMVASFFSVLGVVLIFATNLHQMMLRALYDSYALFPPGRVPDTGDLATMAQGLLSGSFRVGMQIAAPFIVYGITFYIGVGLLTRLMPRLPIFFVIMPLQITASLIILAIVLSSSMIWFLNYFEGRMVALLMVG